MNTNLIEKLKETLSCIDVEIERCCFKRCQGWYVVGYDGRSGRECDHCKDYFCTDHIVHTEVGDLCVNCKLKSNKN